MALYPGSVVGPYTVVASLGSGGMGDVYHARDSRTGLDVAIKTLPPVFALDPERLTRFEREARTLALLSHPNIARIYSVEEIAPPSVPGHPGTRGLVMELIDGEDLSARIARGPIPIGEALEIARQIAGALAAAHDIGVIHRDLKPGNVKVTAEQVKVFDFGLAKFDPSSEGFDSIAVTGKGIIVGTASYMPPEQAKGKQVDARADVWAFGAVLFEMLSGRRAFPGKTIPEILAAVLKAPAPLDALPEGTPAGIRRLLRRCLEKDRKNRPASMAAVRAAIDEAIAGPAASPSPSLSLSALSVIMTRPLWDHRAIAASVLGVATIAVMGFAAYYRLAAIDPPPVLRLSVTPPPGVAFGKDETQPDVALTPDQRRVIILGNAGGAAQYLVRPLDSFDAVAIRGLGELPRGVTVSPDSRWLLFQTGARGGDNAVLHKAPTAGGTPSEIARIDGSLRGASWQADGTIVFATNNTTTGLASIAAGGGPSKVLTVPDALNGELDHLWPHALPGGRYVLFALRRVGQGSDIAVLDRTTGKSRLLMKNGSYPRYVRTGHLLFVAGTTLHAVPFNAEQALVTGNATPVIEGVVAKESGAANFDVSPSGTLVYMTSGPGSSTAPDYRVVLNWFEELSAKMKSSGK